MRPKRPPLKASFLAPTARTTRIVATAACPDCKSTDIKFLLRANTCELVQMLDHTMMKCGACGSEFAAEYVTALAALGARNPSGTISEDLICPECRGSIQGQRAGKPCEACGSLIPEHMAMSRRESSGAGPAKMIIPAIIVALLVGGGYLFAPPPWNKLSILIGFALIEFWQGFYGLATRRIEHRKGRTLKVHQGGKAVLIAVVHILVGAGAIALCWVIRNDILNQ